MSASPKRFNLPWHQHEAYAIGVYAKGGDFSKAVQSALQKAGMKKIDERSMLAEAPRQWKAMWETIFAALGTAGVLNGVEVAVAGSANLAHGERKSPAAMQLIAESLWLGDALLEDRVMCYLQPVISRRGSIFGYEAFARARAEDGSIIGGDKIVAASRALGIEYMIDRRLQVQAITTFVSSEFHGFLFVNFFPGFIHRPEVYLEGLGDTMKNSGIVAKHLVLDFTNAEKPHDMAHMKNVCDYGRSRGYSIALDDIATRESARRLIGEIRPDFVKIDMHLSHRLGEPLVRDTIRTIVELIHAVGGTAIAEGVETEEMHKALMDLGVDLFQGYLFSPPMPVEAVLKRSAL